MEKINPKVVIDFLNTLLEIDRKAITALMINRVSCNENMANHETVQTLTDENNSFVGMLGILNGMCGVNENGDAFIVAEVDDSNDTIEKFIFIDEKPKNK